MTMAYSGTSLAETLGLKPGIRCWFHNMPENVRAAIDPEGLSVEEQPTASDGLQCAHLFVTERDRLAREMAALRPLLATNGFIWVSWPQPGATMTTDLSLDIVRDVVRPAGLLESGLCAVDAEWSALKLVNRKD
ncbi:DUF3052 family protein [Sphingomonas hengshuiensis]|uniref:DUF3052 domain-containing protein n=1 Tax=Sphingomonas hengshuiensis TaxID=1609977 RepID=A0A7U4J9I7_9SPHN|nr:DUF3052 family protein [Sphingomonas hengshuiensis]AJP72750.1 hypothetical protein TS85_14670 [Sphingomonas hengshuiensis]